MVWNKSQRKNFAFHTREVFSSLFFCFPQFSSFSQEVKSFPIKGMEPKERFERSTYRLQGDCSTIELFRHKGAISSISLLLAWRSLRSCADCVQCQSRVCSRNSLLGAGAEHNPVTYGLEDRYSLQLNYWCIKYGRVSPNLPWTTNSITCVYPLAITLIKSWWTRIASED